MINIIIPVILGAIIYYLIAPDVIFVRYIDNFFGISFHINMVGANNIYYEIIRFLRNYLMDMLWGYALMFSLFFVLGNNKADILKSFIIAFTFSVIMEVLQITPAVGGTFDVFDILFEFLSEVVAAFIIIKLTMKEEI